MNLKINNISLSYGHKVLLKNVNLYAEEGQVISLIGRNGTGKSTFMRALLGLQAISSGNIMISEVNICNLSLKQRASIFSYVSTDPINVAYLTVKDVVSMGRVKSSRWNGTLSKHDKIIVEDALRAVSLTDMSNRNITTLSDGERQRVMIAKALSQDTPIILLDEPTAFLDVPNRVQIHSLLSSLASASGKLIIFSTHELELARKYSDFFWFVDNNTITSYSSIDFKFPDEFCI